LKGDFRIYDWRVQPRLNSVEIGCEVVRLEPKVMQVLTELSLHPGDVRTKDDLIHAVWPDTFVGDDALIRCISELRRVFNDSPRSPRVIQTVSKVGYRLIAPVTCESESLASGAKAQVHAARNGTTEIVPFPTAIGSTNNGTEPRVDELQRPPALNKWRTLVWARAFVPVIAVVIVAAIAGSVALISRASEKHPFSRNLRTVPLTSFPGSERQPSFSPDGAQITFGWNGENASLDWNIYTKPIAGETPVRLTNAAATDLNPQWSPDGKWIAFIRRAPSGNGIYLVPFNGGPERRVYELHSAIAWEDPGLSWSPNGRFLAFPDGRSQETPSSIYMLDVVSEQAKPVTHPLNSWDGDFAPVYSPDGSKIAFVRGADAATRNVYVIASGGGEPKQLTFNGRLIFGLSWMPDSSAIVFSSDLGGTPALWRVPVSGGEPERLPVGTEGAITPAISRKGASLAYAQGTSSWSLMRVPLRSPKEAARKVLSSSEQDSAPKFSPDGKLIAFQSWRSGSQEIWTCDGDGKNPKRLTSFEGPLTGSPSWSPDGKSIAFDSRPSGRSHIFVMAPNGGTPRGLTDGDFNDIVPNWSSDGQWIYFASKRSGRWQLWKVPAGSGELRQVTESGGFVGGESPDGKWVYFTKYGEAGLWRVPSAGGAESKIANGPPADYWGYWTLTSDGVYYLDGDGSSSAIYFRGYSSAESTRIRTLERTPPPFSGVSVSPDKHWLLYTDQVSTGYNIMLVENLEKR
jgi:Tol biopolymer transport system component/DNA-binding winged helix-turn-helix (wHTH) protein